MKKTIFSKVCRTVGKKGGFMLALLAFLLLGNVDAQAQSLNASNDSATEYSLVNDAEAVGLLKNSVADIKSDTSNDVSVNRKIYAVVRDIVFRLQGGITLEDAIDNSLDEMLPNADFAVRDVVFNKIISIVQQ